MSAQSFSTIAEEVLATHQAVTTRRGGRVPAPPRTLRELRLAAGHSLNSFALIAGVPKAVISQIERGRIVATTAEADALAAALGLDPGSLETKPFLVHQDRGA